MIKKLFFILLVILSLHALSQDDNLRIETIDVFKEYAPDIRSSVKISDQPIFTDTLKAQIISNKSILQREILLQESIVLNSPSKFRFESSRPVYSKYLSLKFGNEAFFNTKLHYTNGVSMQHNSGFYLEHDSKNRLFLNQVADGYALNLLKFYSNIFKGDNTFQTLVQFNNRTGFYWGEQYALDLPLEEISEFVGNQLALNFNFYKDSQTSLLTNFDCNVNYFHHNYGRQDFFANPSINLQKEQALKKYHFNLDIVFSQSIFNNDSSLVLDNLHYGRFKSLRSLSNDFSDLFISSKMLVSGSGFFDYNVGVSFNYLPDENIKFGGTPQLSPEIDLVHKINNTQYLELTMKRSLVYHSFHQIFSETPFIDPYFRNCLSRLVNMDLMYTKKINQDISFSGQFKYIRERGALIPFVFSQEYLNDLSTLTMNPLGMYRDGLRRGISTSSSISIDKEKYSLFVDIVWNRIKSKNTDYEGAQFIPKIKMNSVLTISFFDKINIISSSTFYGKRDAFQISDLTVDNSFEIFKIDPCLRTDLSISYDFKNTQFLLNIKNIFGQKIDLFHGYYDDDGLRMSLGCVYKF